MMKYFSDLRKKHLVLADTWAAFTVSFVVCCIFDGFKLFDLDVLIDRNLAYCLLQIHASLLGFLIAVMAIILGFEDGPKVQYLRKSSQYKTVIDIYWNSVRWLGILIMLGLFLLVVKYPFVIITKFWVLLSLMLPFMKIRRCVWIAKELFNLSSEKLTINNHAQTHQPQ